MKKMTIPTLLMDRHAIIGAKKLPLTKYNGKLAYPLSVFGKRGTSRKLVALDYVDIARQRTELALIFEGDEELTPVMTVSSLCSGDIRINYPGGNRPANEITGNQWRTFIGCMITCTYEPMEQGETRYVLQVAVPIQPMAVAIERHAVA